MLPLRRLGLVSADAPRRPYPSDWTDSQWAVVAPLLRASTRTGPGRPPQVPLRDVVNALLYIKQTGCPWRYLPHDLPPRSTVHYYFEKWTADGTLEEVGRHLRERVRRQAGRAAQPTAGILDSQTAKSGEATHEVGWD